MQFSTVTFLFAFLPVTLLLNLLAERFKGRTVSNLFLLAASLLFYAWGEPLFVALMLISMLFNWGMALLAAGGRRAALWTAAAVAVNIALLVVFKYLSFIIGAVNGVLGLSLYDPQPHLPIGISFYTFQAISYIVDVRRGKASPERNPLNTMLYIAFFPQLVAGPIVQYTDIAGFIRERRMTSRGMAEGFTRFVAGLSKKLLIANTAAVLADAAFALPVASLDILSAWLGALAYAVQIYFDFSGYSDMAIGLGCMFGFEFKENFRYPYSSNSMREFWRRWHISLSSWFRDYVYIPLGGSRNGVGRAALNRVIVFVLTGLWHGANWTFLVWGLMHGVLMLLETYGIIRVKGAAGRVYALLCAVITFAMFRAETVQQGWAFITAMVSGFTAGGVEAAPLWAAAAPLALGTLALGAVLSQEGVLEWAKSLLPERARATVILLLSLPMLALCALNMAGGGFSPFIYLRF